MIGLIYLLNSVIFGSSLRRGRTLATCIQRSDAPVCVLKYPRGGNLSIGVGVISVFIEKRRLLALVGVIYR